MSVESSFLKDRPANLKEVRNLSDGTPHVQSVSQIEDIFQVRTIDLGAEGKVVEAKSGEKLGVMHPRRNWYFRMN